MTCCPSRSRDTDPQAAEAVSRRDDEPAILHEQRDV